ncbi:phosphatase domain-containing protein [Marimonas sp. MJW-29]|uniref:Phosphatase domain-containing protein n=1 Tax=Sulfitobacter sediminis TaxID=3234186 RepID=A0ABV3RGP6_9RHOB
MVRKALHAVVWRIERVIDAVRGQRDKRRVIEPYIGYATPDHLVVRGRVLTALRRNAPRAEQSRWVNFRQMLGLFLTDEVADVEISAEGMTAHTDEEGYFTLLLARDDRRGWQDVIVRIVDTDVAVACPVMIAGDDAAFVVVSDIDDTMLRTGAYSLARNLWTSLTGNALTRQVFPDAVTFMQHLTEGGRNPVYYVSSSPWNLHDFLATIFDRAGLVRGPKFLRDLGVSRTQFITGTHGDHKGGSIDTLIAAHPGLPFVLVGDTGQHDAFVYLDAIARHPGRIAAVVLREPGPGPDAESREAMARIEQAGTPLLHGPTFEGFGERLLVLLNEGLRT